MISQPTRDMRTAIAVGSVILLCGCGPSTTALRCTTGAPTLGENFTVQYQDTATIKSEALTLRFARLVGDSRCPSDVQCIWEGNAEVEIAARKSSEQPAALSLNTNSRFATQAPYQGYSVHLLSLAPYPESQRAIAASDYCVGLRVTRP